MVNKLKNYCLPYVFFATEVFLPRSTINLDVGLSKYYTKPLRLCAVYTFELRNYLCKYFFFVVAS